MASGARVGCTLFDLDEYPFAKPEAQELFLPPANLYSNPLDPLALIEQHGIDLIEVTRGSSPPNLWHELLPRASGQGTVDDFVAAVRKTFPKTRVSRTLNASPYRS